MENEGAKATGSSLSPHIGPEVQGFVSGVLPEEILNSSLTPYHTGPGVEHHTEPNGTVELPKSPLDAAKGLEGSDRWRAVQNYKEKEQEEIKNAA